MTTFSQRSITGTSTLGERLQRVRSSQGLQIAEVAAELRIRPEYVAAIEASNYTALPGSVFVKNYVRKYAKYLHMNGAEVQTLLDQELKVYADRPDIPITQRHLAKPALSVPKVLVLVLSGVVGLAIISYFLFEISHSIQPPDLALDAVPDKVSATQHSVTISGKTSAEATLSINGQDVSVSTDGHFSELMTVQPGINIFKVVAKTKRSQEKVEYLQVVQE